MKYSRKGKESARLVQRAWHGGVEGDSLFGLQVPDQGLTVCASEGPWKVRGGRWWRVRLAIPRVTGPLLCDGAWAGSIWSCSQGHEGEDDGQEGCSGGKNKWNAFFCAFDRSKVTLLA